MVFHSICLRKFFPTAPFLHFPTHNLAASGYFFPHNPVMPDSLYNVWKIFSSKIFVLHSYRIPPLFCSDKILMVFQYFLELANIFDTHRHITGTSSSCKCCATPFYFPYSYCFLFSLVLSLFHISNIPRTFYIYRRVLPLFQCLNRLLLKRKKEFHGQK